DQHRPDRQRAQLGTGMAGARRVSLLAPPRPERRSCPRGLHVTSVEPSGPFVKRPRRPPVRCPDALLLRVGRWVLKSWLRPPRPGTSLDISRSAPRSPLTCDDDGESPHPW